jgi:hypothetical protein
MKVNAVYIQASFRLGTKCEHEVVIDGNLGMLVHQDSGSSSPTHLFFVGNNQQRHGACEKLGRSVAS